MSNQASRPAPRSAAAAPRGRRTPSMRALVRALAVAGVVSHLGPALPPAAAQVLPAGMSVVRGQATAAIDGSRMTVNNSAGAVLNWQQFSIGAGQQVHFAQPSAASRVLNRVVGNDPSQIFGSLSSNGQVWLLNPQGVIFGRDARVDVGGLVASTLNLSLNDWIGGRGVLSMSSLGAPGAAPVVNEGELRAASGGRIWLLGGEGGVRNDGLIVAPDGQVVLAAGRSVDLVDEHLPNVAVRIGAPGGQALNLGRIAGGRVDLLAAVVNQSGLVHADRIDAGAGGQVRIEASASVQLAAASTTSAGGAQGGGVFVDAGSAGTLLVSGRVQATGDEGAGGQITLLGRHIGLTGDAVVDASGATGGGTVHIGGGLQGRDASVRNAAAVYLGRNASVRADATDRGDGGTIILWSDQATRAYGTLSARGGAAGGDGGFIETSGGWLDARPAGVSTEAPGGKAGTWLLDPYDITIVQGAGSSSNISSAPDFEATGTPAVLYAASIVTALSSTDVTVTTGAGGTEAGNISMNGVTMLPALSAPRSLTLEAANDIDMIGSVIGSSGSSRLTVNFIAGRDLYLDNATLEAYGGPLTANLSAGRDLTIINSDLFATTGLKASLTAGRDLSVGFTDVATTAGPLAVEIVAGENVDLDSAYFRADGGSNDFSATAGGDLSVFNTYFEVIGLAGGPLAVSLVAGGDVDIALGYFGGSGGGPPLALEIAAGGNVYVGASEIYGDGAPSSASISAGGSVNFVSNFSWLYLTGDTGVTIDAAAINVTGSGVDIDVDGPIRLYADSFANSGTMNLWSGAAGTAILVAGSAGANVASFTNSGFLDLNPGSARWLLYLNDGATGVDSLSFDFLQYGSAYPTAPVAAGIGNGILYASDAVLTVSSDSAISKVYDGNRTVTSVGIGLNVSGLRAGHFISDESAFSNLEIGEYVTANAGSDIPIGVSGFSLPLIETNAAYGGPVPVYGYTATSNVRGDITPRPLTLTGVTPADKIYDGNTQAAVTGGSLGNLVAGQTLGLVVLSASFDTPNVGTNKTVTGTVDLVDGTGSASNYTLPGGGFVGQADITPRPLSLGDVLVADKIYDATRTATFVGGRLLNLVDGDTLGLSLSNGLFDTADAGLGKTVTGTATLAGNPATASNYQLEGGGAFTTTGNILQRALTLAGVVAASKTYDGTRAAEISGGALGNLVAGQTLVLSLTDGLFDTADAGTGKTVTGTAILSNGTGLASNYLLPEGSVVATADITRRGLVLSDVAAADKVYDGTRAASLSGYSLANLVAGETLALRVPDAAFDTADAGTGKPVTGNAVLADGSARAANYQLVGGASIATTADIDPRPLTVAGLQAADKVYDGNRVATLSGGTLVNLVPGETLGLAFGGGLFDTADAGIGKSVTAPATLSDGSGRASNYVLAEGGAATTTADIDRRPVTVSGVTAADKIYDGTRAAQLAGGVITNLVPGETLGLGLGGLFDTSDVGVNKPVTGTVTLADGTGRAANYTIEGNAAVNASASITPRPLTVAGVQAADKVYDGTRDAVLSGGSLQNLVAGQTLVLNLGAGLFDTSDAGNGKTVTGTASIADGAGRASNYQLVDAGAVTTTASIARRELSLSGVVANDKVYDGSRAAPLAGGQLANLVAGQSLGLELGGLFDTADTGIDKPVTVTATLVDGNANAANYLLVNPGLSLQAGITPAPLFYVADPLLSIQGRQLPPLTGSVSGFVAGESVASATTGTLGFATPATPESLPGAYAIDGFGLAARNYTLAQAPGNATAMTIAAPPPRAGSNELATVFARLAPASSLPTQAPAADPAADRTLDALRGLTPDGSGAGGSIGGGRFGSIDLDLTPRNALALLLASRDRYKQSIFAIGMRKLEDNPALADLPPCLSSEDAEAGKCLVTEELLARADAAAAATTVAPPPPAAPPAVAPPPAAAPSPPAVAVAPPAPAPVAPVPPPAAPPSVAAAPAPAVAVTPIVVRPKVVAMAKAPPIPLPRPVRAATLPQIQRKIAVLIGLDNYVDERIPLLENAGRDVEAVARVLESQLGYETVIVRDASREAIVGVLNRLALTARPDDSVVVYYAGHGTVVDATGQGYWIPASADAERPESWISNSDIGKLAGSLRASQVALISDSCFSGTLVADRRVAAGGGAGDPAALLQRRAAVVMSSGGNEPVADGARNGHSPFAASLMQSLQQLDRWRAGNNVFEQVRADVTRRLPQTPQYGPARQGRHSEGADYVFEQRQLVQ